MFRNSILGTWPDPDVQIVVDYKQQRQRAGTKEDKSPVCLLRIHMDISIDEDDVDDLIDDLAEDKGAKIYQKIMEDTKQNPGKRGPAVLRAAFRLKPDGQPDDPDTEPEPDV